MSCTTTPLGRTNSEGDGLVLRSRLVATMLIAVSGILYARPGPLPAVVGIDLNFIFMSMRRGSDCHIHILALMLICCEFVAMLRMTVGLPRTTPWPTTLPNAPVAETPIFLKSSIPGIDFANCAAS